MFSKLSCTRRMAACSRISKSDSFLEHISYRKFYPYFSRPRGTQLCTLRVFSCYGSINSSMHYTPMGYESLQCASCVHTYEKQPLSTYLVAIM
jgi:hypothetical protein